MSQSNNNNPWDNYNTLLNTFRATTMATGGSNNVLEDMGESLTCSLCVEIWKDPVSLPCLHTFCRHCLRQHIAASLMLQCRCPLCNNTTSVPARGVDGFPAAFFQARQVEVYKKVSGMIFNTEHMDDIDGSGRMTETSSSRPTGLVKRRVTLEAGEPNTRVAAVPKQPDTLLGLTARLGQWLLDLTLYFDDLIGCDFTPLTLSWRTKQPLVCLLLMIIAIVILLLRVLLRVPIELMKLCRFIYLEIRNTIDIENRYDRAGGYYY